MFVVLKWQDYRKFCVNCILEIHSILNMPIPVSYAYIYINIPSFCMHQESLCARVSQGILKRFLIYLKFLIYQSSESVLETTLK